MYTMNMNPKEGQRTTSKFNHSKIAGPTWTKIRRTLFSQKKSRRHFVFFFISFEFLRKYLMSIIYNSDTMRLVPGKNLPANIHTSESQCTVTSVGWNA